MVLGNPPWDASDLMKVEFFAALLPAVSSAHTTEDRVQLIRIATSEDPRLDLAWSAAQRKNAGESHFLKSCGAFPFTSEGKLNTYRSFAELASRAVAPHGRAGLVLKSGIINAQDNQRFFADLLEHGRVVMVRDFINTEEIFPGVVANERFCCVVLTGSGEGAWEASFMFCLERVEQLGDATALVTLTRDDLITLNPNDLSVPPMTSERDKGLLVQVHRRIPVLVNERVAANRLKVRYSRGHLNSSTDSGLFAQNDFEALLERGMVDADGAWKSEVRPLLEGKLIGSWNHRFGTFHGVPRVRRFGKKAEAREPSTSDLKNPSYRPLPRFWIGAPEADLLLAAKQPRRGWLLAFRHVCRAVVDARTGQACIVPEEPVSDSCALLLLEPGDKSAALSAGLCVAAWTSFVGDYVIRQKLYGPALTKAIALQLPTPSLDDVEMHRSRSTDLAFFSCRILELTYTAWDLEPFARDIGWGGPPFRWDPDRRFLLRAELDAAFFHLYGLSRDDTAYILDTFPIVRKHDEKAHGEYRTKRVILEIYDAMTEATRTGVPYATRLDPPPADPRVAHPQRVVEPVPPIPLTPRRPLPQWGPRVFEVVAQRANSPLHPGDWHCGLSGDVLGEAALAAVLRNLPEPRPREEVERAVILVVLPRLMVPAFGAGEAATWRSLVGTAEVSLASVNDLGIPWRAVVRRALQRGVLVDAGVGQWEAGAEAAGIPSEVLDARALVALSWMATAPAIAPEILRETELLDVA